MAHWGLREAIRELLQNAIDSGAYTVEQRENTLFINNELTAPLSIDNLTLLGETTKHSSSTIGKFGEGFKLALLVLGRAQVPHVVTIGQCQILGYVDNNRFVMQITGELPEVQTSMSVAIAHPEAYDLACNMLVRKADFKEIASTVNARAFTPGGTLFVGGLKVCDNTGMKYSYDLSPKDVQLERDRNTVRSFELEWAASKFWAQQSVTEDLVADVFNNVPDVQYITSHSPSRELFDAVWDHYLKFYGPETILAETKEKAKAFQHLYQRVEYVGGGAYFNMVTSHKNYSQEVKQAKRIKPADAVQTFVDENIKHMRSKARRAAKKLKLTTAHW
jgi:hypothetical protein